MTVFLTWQQIETLHQEESDCNIVPMQADIEARYRSPKNPQDHWEYRAVKITPFGHIVYDKIIKEDAHDQGTTQPRP